MVGEYQAAQFKLAALRSGASAIVAQLLCSIFFTVSGFQLVLYSLFIISIKCGET
jgi:hypothetical protein